MTKPHLFTAIVTWTGNQGKGTLDYKSYSRNHEISIEGKLPVQGSSDAAFRGDKTRYSPEDLLVASLSGCHMLWYLHLCAINGVVVIDYVDHASGEMMENQDGTGQFTNVTLRPRVTVSAHAMVEKANMLHEEANKMCFIARSVNFPVHHLPEILCYQKV